NPSGPRLLGHVTGYLGKNYLLDSTAEYQSPDFHLLYGRVFLAVLCGMIALLALAAHRPTFPRLLTILANTAFALTSLRNIPLFGVVALPLLSLHLSERPSFRLWPSGLEATFREAGAQAAVGAWSFLGVLALTASAFAGKLSGGFDPSV